MFKRAAALALALLLLLPAAPGALAEQSGGGSGATRYAVFYDFRTQEGAEMLELLRRIATYSSWQCSYVDVWDAARWEGEFDAAVVCAGGEEELPDSFVTFLKGEDAPVFVIGGGGLAQLTEEAVWRNGEVVLRCGAENGETSDIALSTGGLWMLRTDRSESLGGQVYVNNDVYPLCQRVDDITHFAYCDAREPLLSAELARCLQLWQWPYDSAPTAYGQYLVINNIYPFLDLDHLTDHLQVLEDAGVSYILAVTPVFSNGEYPAMKRFCEFLRYAQSRGAGIILRVPFVSIEETDLEELIRHMSLAYAAYALYGVYPLAIEAPETWLQCDSGLEALRGFRTVFTFATDETLQGPAMTENASYQDGHQIVAPAWEDEQAFSSSYAQAIYFDAQSEPEELGELISRLKASKRVLKDLAETENRVYCGDYMVVNYQRQIQVNGQYADLRYVPFTYDEHYTFDRGITQYFKEQIETSNRYMMIFVAATSVLFVGMILLFRRQIRRELLLGKRKKKNRKENQEDDEQDRGADRK